MRAVLSTVDAPCAVCGGGDADPVWATPDRAFAVPGHYTVVRCRGCGFLYQRPRVRDEHLAACYPDRYPRHQEPSPRAPFKGSAARRRAVRYALANGLGYRAFDDELPALDRDRPLSRCRVRLGRGAGRRAGTRLADCGNRDGAREAGRADRLVPAPGEAALVLVESIGAPSHTLAKLTESRPVYGVLKLGLEVLVPLARLARRGEAIRVGAVRNRPT